MISGITNAVYANLPEFKMHSLSKAMQNVAKNVTKMAIPAIMLCAASIIQGAEAGPLAYASCMAGCAALPPICAAGGWAACIALAVAPGP